MIGIVSQDLNGGGIPAIIFQDGNTGAIIFPQNLFPYAGLVSYYRLNGNANDATGSNNGITHSITFATGKTGQGAQFPVYDGTFNAATNTGSYISMSYFGALGNNTFTLAMWYWPPSVASASYLFGWGNFTAGFRFIPNQIEYEIEGLGGPFSSSFGLTASTWNHIAVTKTTTAITLYVNAIPTSYPFAGVVSGLTQFCGLGYYWREPGANYAVITGSIDEFGVWNRALDQYEMNALASGLFY